MTDQPPDAALAEVRRDAISRGYVEGLDFYVQGFHTTFSSELVLLVRDADRYSVVYRDMGQERVLIDGPTADSVREEFMEALRRLGRGREAVRAAGREPVAPRSDEEILAQFLRDYPDSVAVKED